MKNLIDNIIDELEEEGIWLLEENNDSLLSHRSYQEADRDKIKKALLKALEKSMGE